MQCTNLIQLFIKESTLSLGFNFKLSLLKQFRNIAIFTIIFFYIDSDNIILIDCIVYKPLKITKFRMSLIYKGSLLFFIY